MSTTTKTYELQRSQIEKIIDAECLRRVKEGIKLLEEKHGPDWVENINLRTLSLSDSNQCVLGQVYEAEAYDGGYDDGYQYGVANLNLEGDDDRFGFDSGSFTHQNGSSYILNINYDDLDQMWQQEIVRIKEERIS